MENNAIKEPFPGSKEAISNGCLCPVIDNHYGRGRYDNYQSFIVNANCLLHGENLRKAMSESLPTIIKTEEENQAALKIVEKFMRRGEDNLSPEEQKLCTLYIRLIEDYEERAYPEIGDKTSSLPE